MKEPPREAGESTGHGEKNDDEDSFGCDLYYELKNTG